MSFKLTDFITVTSTGNVGIGTTSPDRNLSIFSPTDTSVEIKSGTTNQSSLWFTDTGGGTGAGGILYTHNDNAMAFRVNDSTRLTISSGGDATFSGNVSLADTKYIQLNNTSTDWQLRADNAGRFVVQTSGGSEFFKISPGGASTFQLSALTNPSGVDANTGVIVKNNGWSGITLLSSATAGSFLTFGDEDAGFRGRIQYLHSTDAMVFETAASEKMRITSTGAIAVGSSSTNYGSSGQVLTSNGNASPSWTSTSGAKGEPGTTGAQGTAGSNGSNGAQGTAGTNGSNGSNGAVGSQGTNGSTGAQGAVGLNGGTGAQGATGATGGSGGTGAQGTAGTNGSNGGTGAQGATGATGGSGGTGAQGSTGSNGGTGAQGTAGSNGSNGNNGAQGTTGAQGSTGSTGSNGSNGGTGAQGTSGVATFPYSGTATFSNQIRLSNSGGYLYGGTITTRLGSRAIDMGYNGSCYFQANRTDSSSAQFLCGSATSMTGIWSRVGTTNGGVSYDSGPRVFKITMGTTVRMQMDTNGVITGDFNDISDILFKKNIEFHGYGLVAVNSLKPREFNWKQINRPQEKQIGFIAQEVEEIIPEVIHGFDGNKSINGTGLISILTKAIQELSQEVTTLKAEVELLKQQ